MTILYYHPICPFSRQTRVFLYENMIQYTLKKENYWQLSKEFISLSPTGALPILFLLDENIVCAGMYSVLE
jgi:glutathione S-transferase